MLRFTAFYIGWHNISFDFVLGHPPGCDPKVTQKRGPLQISQASLQLSREISVKALGELGGTRPSPQHEVGMRSTIPQSRGCKDPRDTTKCGTSNLSLCFSLLDEILEWRRLHRKVPSHLLQDLSLKKASPPRGSLLRVSSGVTNASRDMVSQHSLFCQCRNSFSHKCGQSTAHLLFPFLAFFVCEKRSVNYTSTVPYFDGFGIVTISMACFPSLRHLKFVHCISTFRKIVGILPDYFSEFYVRICS